jgi:hypothetical protein
MQKANSMEDNLLIVVLIMRCTSELKLKVKLRSSKPTIGERWRGTRPAEGMRVEPSHGGNTEGTKEGSAHIQG